MRGQQCRHLSYCVRHEGPKWMMASAMTCSAATSSTQQLQKQMIHINAELSDQSTTPTFRTTYHQGCRTACRGIHAGVSSLGGWSLGEGSQGIGALSTKRYQICEQ